MKINIDNMGSYKTEAKLHQAVENKFRHIGAVEYLVVCNRGGRFVAVFPVGWNSQINPGEISMAGFLVVG